MRVILTSFAVVAFSLQRQQGVLSFESFNPQNDIAIKLIITTDTSDTFSGLLILDQVHEITESSVYYLILPFETNNLRSNAGNMEVANRNKDGMSLVFLLISPTTSRSNYQIDFDIMPQYKKIEDFYIQELDNNPNFIIIRLAGNNENQNTLYFRYNISDYKNSFGNLELFADKMLYPKTIEFQFPENGTRFSGIGESSNISNKKNPYPGIQEGSKFILPIEFFQFSYLWINYNYISPVPSPKTLLAILAAIVAAFSIAALTMPEELLKKKTRLILATIGISIATILLVLGFIKFGVDYFSGNLTELLVALPVYLISVIVIAYNLIPTILDRIRKRRRVEQGKPSEGEKP